MKNRTFEECFRDSEFILMEGGLSERAKREYGLRLNDFISMARLVDSERGRSALEALWTEYAEIAYENNLPFMATTTTRRANRKLSVLAMADDKIIKRNVDFLKYVRNSQRAEMYVGGLVGCTGDAYTGKGCLGFSEAAEFHEWEVGLFDEAGVDFLYAGIMPTKDEAKGMAEAVSRHKIPYIISFTIEANGCLVDGTPISAAIREIDCEVENRPLCYMTNCVHPSIVYRALSQPVNDCEEIRSRFLGIQANTSPLSYAELDNSVELKTTSPGLLAKEMMKLNEAHRLKIFGGCCGTDGRHMRKIAESLKTAGSRTAEILTEQE